MPTLKGWLKERRRSNGKLEISSPGNFKHLIHIDERDLPSSTRNEVRYGRSHSEVGHVCTMPRPRLDDRLGSSSLLDHVVPHTTKDDLRHSAGRYKINTRPALPPNWLPTRDPSPIDIPNGFTSPITIDNPAYFIPRGTPTSSGYGTTTNTSSSFGSKTTFLNQVYVSGEMRERYREHSRERQLTGILKGGVYCKKDGADGSLPGRMRANTPQNSPRPAPRRQLSTEPPQVPRPNQLSLSTPATPLSTKSTLDLSAPSSVSISFNDERPISSRVRELYERPPSPGPSSDDELIITHF